MIKKDIPLNKISYWGIGGPARFLLEVHSAEDLVSGLAEWQELMTKIEREARKVFVIGGCTNVLIDDRGYNGLIIHNLIDEILEEGNTLTFGAGLPFQKAVDYTAKKSFSGFEWAGGLPGSIGGAVRGNAGAFGGETKDNILEVDSYNLKSLESHHYNLAECRFGYRTSIFKTEKTDDFIISAKFRLENGDKKEIEKAVQEKIEYRESRQPLGFPSAGSTFKNVPVEDAPPEVVKDCKEVIKTDPFPVIPVAHLLSESGLKGKTIGNAQIAEQHPNFILNLGNASATDVLSLINYTKDAVFEKFRVKIEPEIMFLDY